MYINSLIYLLATKTIRPGNENDTNYKVISTLSKYQHPIHNYKSDSYILDYPIDTVEGVLSHLINAAKKDITVLSYKEPQTSSFRNIFIIVRLENYIRDLNLLYTTSDSWLSKDYIEDADKYLKEMDSTIQKGINEIKHSYQVIEKSLTDCVLPKLAHSETNADFGRDIVGLEAFVDDFSQMLEQEEPFRRKLFDTKILENLKNTLDSLHDKTQSKSSSTDSLSTENEILR